jgi:hypothetical protein
MKIWTSSVEEVEKLMSTAAATVPRARYWPDGEKATVEERLICFRCDIMATN